MLAVAVLVAVYRPAPWRGLAVKALAGWTIAVWLFRAFGIATGDHDTAFVTVHLALAIVSIALSVLAVLEGARSVLPAPSEPGPA